MEVSGLIRSMRVHTQVSLDIFMLWQVLSKEEYYFCPFTGSNVIVAGTAIFNAQDPEKVIATLKASVDAAQATFSKS